MAGRHAGLHSGRREGQPWLEALDRRRQTVPGGFEQHVFPLGLECNQSRGNAKIKCNKLMCFLSTHPPLSVSLFLLHPSLTGAYMW